jgi:hypothetical protein
MDSLSCCFAARSRSVPHFTAIRKSEFQIAAVAVLGGCRRGGATDGGFPSGQWNGTLRTEARWSSNNSGTALFGNCLMTSHSESQPRGRSGVNPKIDPAPNSNTEKKPDDWVSGDDAMTGAQASYLKTLSEECGEPDSFQPDLTKSEASKRIDALKAKRGAVQHR